MRGRRLHCLPGWHLLGGGGLSTGPGVPTGVGRLPFGASVLVDRPGPWQRRLPRGADTPRRHALPGPALGFVPLMLWPWGHGLSTEQGQPSPPSPPSFCSWAGSPEDQQGPWWPSRGQGKSGPSPRTQPGPQLLARPSLSPALPAGVIPLPGKQWRPGNRLPATSTQGPEGSRWRGRGGGQVPGELGPHSARGHPSAFQDPHVHARASDWTQKAF